MLEKTYHPDQVESRIFERWERSGAFEADPAAHNNAFAVMMPPPNVTGSLHMGHALNMTLQDVLTRYHRMNGRNALWQPGTDHAGIATQMVVERQLRDEGTDRVSLGREKFVERVWQWKAESGGTIVEQLRQPFPQLLDNERQHALILSEFDIERFTWAAGFDQFKSRRLSGSPPIDHSVCDPLVRLIGEQRKFQRARAGVDDQQ